MQCKLRDRPLFSCPKALSVSAVVLMRIRRVRIDHRCEAHIPADSTWACYMIAPGVCSITTRQHGPNQLSSSPSGQHSMIGHSQPKKASASNTDGNVEPVFAVLKNFGRTPVRESAHKWG